uniref:Uncharacterized protein n=1 Tax=Arundo donax TaxID=35708 RepID=A0A0A9AY30_ARUDO
MKKSITQTKSQTKTTLLEHSTQQAHRR